MNGLNVSLAPGCYGMSMCYRDGSTECGSCPFAASCKPMAEAQLAMLRAEHGIVVPEIKPAPPKIEDRPEVSPSTLELTNGLPKKVAAWIHYIEREGIKVTEALANGENPFTGRRPTFLNIACLLLLKVDRGVTRDMLRHAFITKLEWGEETATAHITQTRQILTAIGAADDIDGVLRLRAA